MIHNKVLAMILVGGKGERLMPLTEHRSKPAVPFAAKYRIEQLIGVGGMGAEYVERSVRVHL